ncbi:MAG: hypothetical protein WDN00_09470 [Limisphaerales bacterium]
MSEFIFRTEDIRTEEILGLYVETTKDKRIVDLLKSANPVILEGSRGTGKSFLLRVAETQLLASFQTDRVLPVYVSFVKSSLLQSSDPQQFLHWMMAKLCSRTLRTLHQSGLLIQNQPLLSILSGGKDLLSTVETPIEKVAAVFEESYRKPGQPVDSAGIPTVEDFKDAIEDICRSRNLKRIAFFIDEAAHIFRPEQQRQFFTLFRDLRSPFITCNAAVYPGVTAYGQTFQAGHDAMTEQINRDVLDKDYLVNMREIVFKQADSNLMADITTNGENFSALAFAVSGNPRLLLKTIARAGRLRSSDVEKVLKEFYRNDVWSEHSALAERYAGHRGLIDWGRQFIENTVIPDARTKNATRESAGKAESTAFFWVHRDAPETVKEALRLLSYTGIVALMDSWVAGTRSEIGTRYSINLGCLAATDAKPIGYLSQITRDLSIKRFTEYGANHAAFQSLNDLVGPFKESDLSQVLIAQLAKPISVLDLTDYQRNGLVSIGLDTVGKALNAGEEDFQKISYVGPKRSRRIMNIALASVLEYLSG